MLLADKSAYCQFFELQGYQVIETANTIWINVRNNVFQPAPPFNLQPEQASEAGQVLRRARGLLCRWFTPVISSDGAAQLDAHASVYLLRPPYDMGRIQSKARNQTRRGLERVRVNCVKFDAAVEQAAFSVYADNVGRLELFRTPEQLKRRWTQWVNALSRSRCAEFWGAWEDDRLVAFSVVVFSPWGAEIMCQRSLASHLNHYPNNALVFNIATSVFQRGVTVLSYGLGEFESDQQGLDHFKKGMAFEEVPLREHFCWHPALRLLNPILTAGRLRSAARLAKRCDGILRGKNHGE
jgi:hypothetical protein